MKKYMIKIVDENKIKKIINLLEKAYLTKNKVNASASGRSSSLLAILFHIFLLAGSQENIKKMLLDLLSSLRLRHSILLFGRKIKMS